MSLLRCVKQCRLLQPLVGRSFSSGPPPPASGQRSSPVTAQSKEDASPTDGLQSTADAPLKSFDEIPTPGNKWTMVWSNIFPTDNFHEQSLEATLSVGKLSRIPIPFFDQPLLVTSSPQHVSEMFRNEGELPFRPGANHLEDFMEEKGFSKGIVITNWEEWRGLRSKANKQIVPRKILEFTSHIYDVSGDVMDCFRANRGLDNTVNDVLTPLMDWSFEGIGIFILGKRLNLFSAPAPRMKEFQAAGLCFIDGLGPMMNVIPWHKFFPTPTSIKIEDAVRCLETIAGELAEERMAELKQKIDSGEEVEGICFLDQWLLDDRISRKEMFSLMRDFLSAGIDTTSVTATWMLHELARHPEVQQKLREEVLSVLGPTAVPTSKQLQELRYAKNIINETLRLRPVIGGNIRGLDSEVVLDGYKIPKGSWIISDGYSMSRDPMLFEDPLLFNPDRWTRESKKEKAYAHLPFGFGPRACYGRRLAELELVLFLVQVVRNFELRTDQVDLKMRGLTVLKPNEPVRIQFNEL